MISRGRQRKMRNYTKMVHDDPLTVWLMAFFFGMPIVMPHQSYNYVTLSVIV